jgi:hypothetical protein
MDAMFSEKAQSAATVYKTDISNEYTTGKAYTNKSG